MNGNITTAPLGGNRNIKTKPLFQYDYGQVLKIVGVTLPAAYEVHFSNQLHGVATTQIGNADGVIIPDIYLTTGEPVYAWIYLHTSNADGETEYTITIPVVRRASISDAEPTPVQQDVITQAIAALNTAVEQTAQDVQDATEAKEDAEEAAGNAYESAVAAAQSAANAGTYAGQAQSAQTASELAQQKAEEAQTGAQTAKWAAESAQTAAEAAQAGAVAARTGAETAQAWAVAARSGAEAAQHAAEAARDEITGLSATANTLPAGSQATASYNDGLLTIGVPKGEKGDTGDTGATPDFTIGTVSTLPAGSSATASITGTAEDPVLNLGIPKGDQGEVSQAEFDALSDTVDDMQDTLEHKADIDGYYTDMTVGAAEQVVSSTMVEDNAPYKLRTSGGSTDIGNRAYVDKIVGGTVAWNQQVRDAASENVTEYADVVTVTDAVVDDAAVKVMVEPVQDLHGYDSPWPAGGGKNLFDKSNTVQGLWKPEGVYESNSSYVTIYCNVLPNTTYTLSGWNWDSKRMCYFNSYEPQTFTYRDAGTASTFTTGADTVMVSFSPSVTSYGDGNGVQLELGSTATAFAPYENLCPISGWDEVNITRSGANLLPTYTQSVTQDGVTYTVNSDGSVTVNGTATRTNTFYASGSTWQWDGVSDAWLSGCPAGGDYQNGYSLRVDPVTSGYSSPDTGNGVRLSGFNIQYNMANVPLRFCIVVRANTVCDNVVFRPMLNFGLSALPYTPYTAINTYTITLSTAAGTVYGGVLTVNKDGTGSLVVDRAELDLGTLSWSLQTSHRFQAYNVIYAKPTGSYDVANNCFCSEYATRTQNQVYNGVAGIAIHGLTGRSIYVWDSRFDNAATFKSAMSGVQLVYELATPVTYSLTASQVQTLLGTNYVWSDAGQLSLTYTGTDEYLTLTSGRKYMTRINGTDSMVLGAGQSLTAVKGRDNVFDLTQMLGTSVADYVYQQGAGFFRKWFGSSHYAYNAGELISVQGLQSRGVTGFNQWDEEWELGTINSSNGQNVNATNKIRSKNYTPVLNSMTYYIDMPDSVFNNSQLFVALYDSSQNYIRASLINAANGFASRKMPPSFLGKAAYIRLWFDASYGTTYKHDICINLAHNDSRNGEYEPYTHRSYPLDSTLTLRGILKAGSNGVYWDGDEYAYDGTVKRRYGVVDLGTLNWSYYQDSIFYSQSLEAIAENGTNVVCTKYLANSVPLSNPTDKSICFASSGNDAILRVCDTSYSDAAAFKASLSGVYLVYELNTPTTDETAQPYQHIQSVDDWGTEEFVSGTIMPVGHVTRYPSNLRDKLQHLPALASANGSYLITQTDGQMVLSPFPAPPTTAGNYLLKATVSGGNATYSWVAQ